MRQEKPFLHKIFGSTNPSHRARSTPCREHPPRHLRPAGTRFEKVGGHRQNAGHHGAQKGTTGNLGIAGYPRPCVSAALSLNTSDKTIVSGCCPEQKSRFIFNIHTARGGQRNSIFPALEKPVVRLNREFRSAGKRDLKRSGMAQKWLSEIIFDSIA